VLDSHSQLAGAEAHGHQVAADRPGRDISSSGVGQVSEVTVKGSGIPLNLANPVKNLDWESGQSMAGSKKLSKFLNGQSRIADNSSHGERIDGILAWDCQDTPSVRHHHMYTLPQNPETCSFKCCNCAAVVDSDDFEIALILIRAKSQEGKPSEYGL